jgi:hypothetical protein
MEVAEADAVNAEKVRLQPPGKGGTRLPVPKKGEKQGPRRVTVTVKQAIEAAIQPGGCHPQGLAGWLIERAKGSLGDRQIFASVVNKFVPVQLNANIDGGIKLELGWLGGRQVGTTPSQLQQEQTQVIELKQETEGVYRIVDPQPVEQPSKVLEPSTIPDPHPPSKPGAGG